MSVAGVASATVISEYLSVLLIMMCLMRCDGGIRFLPGQLRIDGDKLKAIIKIGLPEGIQDFYFQFPMC